MYLSNPIFVPVQKRTNHSKWQVIESLDKTVSLLQDFLRSTPDCVFTSALYHQWMATMNCSKDSDRIQAIRQYVSQLFILSYLCYVKVNIVLLSMLPGHGSVCRTDKHIYLLFSILKTCFHLYPADSNEKACCYCYSDKCTFTSVCEIQWFREMNVPGWFVSQSIESKEMPTKSK